MALGPHNTLNGDDWDLPEVRPVSEPLKFATTLEEVLYLRAQLAAAKKTLEEIANQGKFEVTPGTLRTMALEALRSLNNGE